jgi:hypothetical protein
MTKKPTAVIERRVFASQVGRQQCSDSGLRDLRFTCSLAADGSQVSTGCNVASTSSKWAPAIGHQRVLPGGSFRAAENLALAKFRTSAAQLAMRHRHC